MMPRQWSLAICLLIAASGIYFVLSSPSEQEVQEEIGELMSSKAKLAGLLSIPYAMLHKERPQELLKDSRDNGKQDFFSRTSNCYVLFT